MTEIQQYHELLNKVKYFIDKAMKEAQNGNKEEAKSYFSLASGFMRQVEDI